MIDGDENDRSEPNESLIMDPLSENLLGTVESTANTDIHEKRKRSLAECVVLSVSGFKKPRMSADSGVGEEVEEVVSSPLHPGSSIVEATVAAQPGEFPNERPTCKASVDELEIVDDGESSAASSDDRNSGSKSTIVFPNVTYLGSASIVAPKAEDEIYKNMEVMNSESKCAITVNLSVPDYSEGLVRLVDPTNASEISSYRIHRILFCARGIVESPEATCFAFTCSHGDGPTSIIYQCHVFRTCTVEVVSNILMAFATAFKESALQTAADGTRFCRICLESEGDTPLISPCLCRGSAGLCHSACLQTWLRTKETSKPSDLLRCGVCKGRYHVKIAYEEEGNRISNTKDLFKLMLWFYCVCFVILAPLLIYRSCMDYLTSRSPYILFITILNCLGFVAYLLFSVYAVNAWIIPAVERWFNSNRRLVVRPEVQEKDGEIAEGEEMV